MTKDVAHISASLLHQIARRAPAAQYVARQQDEITPLMLAEHAPPDWVHTVFHGMDPRTKLYLPHKDYDLSVNALMTARAAREGGVEEMFYRCAEEAGPGNGMGM